MIHYKTSFYVRIDEPNTVFAIAVEAQVVALQRLGIKFEVVYYCFAFSVLHQDFNFTFYFLKLFHAHTRKSHALFKRF